MIMVEAAVNIILVLIETSMGGDLPHFGPRVASALGKHARAPTTHDSTRYGLSRSSPRTFLAHPIAHHRCCGYLSSHRSRRRNYHTSRRTRHELQAHHGHVALVTATVRYRAMVSVNVYV